MYYRYVELGYLVLCPVLLGNKHITKNMFFFVMILERLKHFVLLGSILGLQIIKDNGGICPDELANHLEFSVLN